MKQLKKWLLIAFAAAGVLLALLGISQLNGAYMLRGLDVAILGLAFAAVCYTLLEHEEKLAKVKKGK